VEPPVSTAWIVILGLCLATVVIKAVGPLLIGARRPPERAVGVIALTAPALLAALVVYESVGVQGEGVRLDARLVGVAAALAAAALRASIVVIIAVAAGSTALTRLLF
jgi:hypothetical protein